MSYAINKLKSRTINKLPTLTDQSAAKDTDRNVIVKKFMIHGQVPSGTKPPIYADFTKLPRDLQGFLRQAQSVARLRKQLPPEFADLTMEAILKLTPEQIAEKLKKPEPPANKEGETK